MTRVEIVVNSVPRLLPSHIEVGGYGTSGFEWGYGGAGPSQLALAMCVELFGPKTAKKTSQFVLDALIRPLPMELKQWQISGTNVFNAIPWHLI